LHKVGLIHDDLRRDNVVINENDDAQIIDISNGTAFMMGWRLVLDGYDDPRRDIYGLAVIIWEIIHDRDDVEILTPVKITCIFYGSYEPYICFSESHDRQ
jgi:hypothetical protein